MHCMISVAAIARALYRGSCVENEEYGGMIVRANEKLLG